MTEEVMRQATEKGAREAALQQEKTALKAASSWSSLHKLGLPARLQASPALARPYLIDWIPTTVSGFISVFGDSRASDQDEVRKVHRSRETFESRWAAPRNEMELTQALANAAEVSGIVLIRGHNEAGEFVLPQDTEGTKGEQETRIHIKKVGAACLRARVLCIFITCNSIRYLPQDQFGVNRYLSVDEAIQLSGLAQKQAQILEQELKQPGEDALLALRSFGVKLHNRVLEERHLKISLFVFGSVLVAMLIVDEEREGILKSSLGFGSLVEDEKVKKQSDGRITPKYIAKPGFEKYYVFSLSAQNLALLFEDRPLSDFDLERFNKRTIEAGPSDRRLESVKDGIKR